MPFFIELEDVTLTRAGHRMVGPVTLTVESGCHLALVGGNGSGKTSLLKLLRGDMPPDGGGRRTYDFGEGAQQSPVGVRHRIGVVSADQQDFYSLHAPRTLGRTVVLSGFYDTPLLYEKPSKEQEAAADAIISQLGIKDIVRSRLSALSTGQLRKLIIARALVSKPDFLLLDECLEGLDVVSRGDVLGMLERVDDMTTMVCAAHRLGDVPRNIAAVVVMRDGLMVRHASRDDALELLQEQAPELAACDIPNVGERKRYKYLLRMRDVSVVSDGERILYPMSWDVLPGENWAVLGGNGAGKSTLLKLITSEISPYAEDDTGVGVIQRLGGLTMDEARPLIGVVSPSLQITYGRELAWEVTALETVLSGYRGSVGMLDEPTDEEVLGAREWLERVGLAGLADRPLRRMSYGQQRRVLLARALVSCPDLLLLDEPMSGLDPESRGLMLALLQQIAEAGVPLIMVTHHEGDRIPAINRVMLLKEGKQVFCGSREEFESEQKNL